MKKISLIFVSLTLVLGLFIFAAPRNVDAQTYYRKVVRHGRVYYIRQRKKPSYYRRHRNLINVGAATAGGALVGGLIGGRKGMLVGAGAGAGSGALYTYVFNKKKRKYVKVRRYRRYRRP